ncbi:ABC transporter ATP-binding protein [soil metagenome]
MKDFIPLLPYLKRYKKKLMWGFICVIFYILFFTLLPYIVGNAIDELQHNPDSSVLFKYFCISVGTVLIGSVFLFFTRRTIIVASREIENDLRHDFFEHIETLPRNFYNTTTTGNLMALATNDLNAIRNFVGPGIMYTMQTTFRTIVTVTVLLYISPMLTLFALLPLPIITYLVFKIGRLTHQRSLRVQESFADVTTRTQENISGIRIIKSFVREDREIEKFKILSKEYFKKNLSLAKVQSFSFPMMQLLTGISIIIVIYFGGMKVISGELTYGDITKFVMYLGSLTWPMIAMGWIINLIQRAAPSMNRINEIIKIIPDIRDDNNTDLKIRSEDIEGEIEFKNVSFKYHGTEKYILKNFNLKINKGTTLGIVGLTGTGKTTLINLLPRVYDISEGEILIDGINIKKIPLNILRNSIGIVPQDSFLFSTTIEKNISYSKDYIDYDEIVSAARSASLYKDVDDFPNKFQTVVGERGITLSGGQKQRTSLARAIYKKPKVLILDDSLSAVDTHTEEEILGELKKIMADRTSIIISHRISSIQNANNIIVISGSVIKEEGTHNELLVQGGIYFDLYQKQLLEEEIVNE